MHFPTFSISCPSHLETPRAPELIHVQGCETALALLSRLPDRGLAIVGSRLCQSRSRELIRSSLARLRGFDLIVVSGLAQGIDSEAHLSALEYGFPTIAILGCGLNRTYPIENHRLRERILEAGGLIISEFEPDAEPRGFHFIQRNRLIAGWSRAVWVVEAGFRSGAVNTASWAKRQDRPCLVTPCFPGDPTLAGNQRLLEQERVEEGEVICFWDARSLGRVWLELESFLARPKTRNISGKKVLVGTSEKDDVKALMRNCVSVRTLQNGGIPLTELLDWGRAQNILPDEFFAALRESLHGNELTLRCGIVSHP